MTEALAPEALRRLDRDLRALASDLSVREARYLVDAYYTIQHHRIEAQNQVRSMTADAEPNLLLEWLFDQHRLLEREIQKVLGDYSENFETGLWARSIIGIGPVITAGLLAHIDIDQAPTVGHIWRYAGLDPTVKWERGQKRPWNAELKKLCWKIGESFVKNKSRPCLPKSAMDLVSAAEEERAEEAESTETSELIVCIGEGCMNYGHTYVRRKAFEATRNEEGLYADQAERALAEKNYGKTTEAFKWYSKGQLPPARIHARARRYSAKLFLAHFHHVLYEDTFRRQPPKPYVIEQLGHAHYTKPPNWPLAV